MSRIRQSIVIHLLAAGAMFPVCISATPAAAQQAPEDAVGAVGAVRPWAQGVPAERQLHAMELYEAGTQALKNLQFAAAEARYREALAHWEHPSIHYHLAIVLISLDRPIDAYGSVLASLRHDGAALHDHERMQALQYKVMLQQRLATLHVENVEPGSVLMLDGERLLVGAGRRARLVLAGEHQVVVRKPGHATWTDSLKLPPGAGLALAVRGRREMVARWMPWALVGAGAAVGGAGGLLHWRASVDMDRFDENIASLCPEEEPCSDDAPGAPVWLMRRAYREQRVAVAAYAAGAGIAVAGLVLMWLNPERSFLSEQRRTPWKPSLTPLIAPASAGMSVSASF